MNEFNIQSSAPNDVKLMDDGEVVWEGTMLEFANAVARLKAPDEKLYRNVACDCGDIGGPDCRAGYEKVEFPL